VAARPGGGPERIARYVTVFRHADPRFPFLWETGDQPPARWNARGEGPVQYLADTPDGAWAEFLRHEGITETDDLRGIERDLWAIELPPEQRPDARPELPVEVLEGGLESYPACREEARRLRGHGASGLLAPSAALLPGTSGGWRVREGGVRPGPPRSGEVVVFFGRRPDLTGWCACFRGRPHPGILPNVRHLRRR
jgi:hypothetical protein